MKKQSSHTQTEELKVQISFLLTPIRTSHQEAVLNKLSWYDSTNGLQYEGVGGEMFFVYDHINKRMVPRIRDVYATKQDTTYGELKKLLGSLNVDFEIEDDVPNKEITIVADEKDAAFLENKLRYSKLCKISTEVIDGKANKGRSGKNARTTGKGSDVLRFSTRRRGDAF